MIVYNSQIIGEHFNYINIDSKLFKQFMDKW